MYFTFGDFVSAYSIANKWLQQLNVLIMGVVLVGVVITDKHTINVEPMKYKFFGVALTDC